MSDDEMIQRLSTLEPTRGVDATAIAFEAGRRSARASVVRWRTAMAATAGVAVMALAWPRGSTPASPQPIAAAPAPAADAPVVTGADAPIPRDNVLALREAILAHGLDGLPALPRPAAAPARPDLLRELLGGES